MACTYHSYDHPDRNAHSPDTRFPTHYFRVKVILVSFFMASPHIAFILYGNCLNVIFSRLFKCFFLKRKVIEEALHDSLFKNIVKVNDADGFAFGVGDYEGAYGIALHNG
jgi:hypothetical protein